MSPAKGPTGWKNPEKGPRCPGCGYPVFGLKDMRCPECGRTLDVRDFSVGEEGEGEYRKKLSRSGAIGGVIAIGVVLLVVIGLFTINAAAFSVGFIVPSMGAGFIISLIWLGRVMMSAKDDVVGGVKRRKK